MPRVRRPAFAWPRCALSKLQTNGVVCTKVLWSNAKAGRFGPKREISGSAAEVGKACELARTTDVDFAILDLNLNGASSIPVAIILSERHIPFVFSTGYGAAGAPHGFALIPVLSKPFVIADLHDNIAAALGLHR